MRSRRVYFSLAGYANVAVSPSKLFLSGRSLRCLGLPARVSSVPVFGRKYAERVTDHTQVPEEPALPRIYLLDVTKQPDLCYRMF